MNIKMYCNFILVLDLQSFTEPFNWKQPNNVISAETEPEQFNCEKMSLKTQQFSS